MNNNMVQWLVEANDLIYLAGCALHGITPDEKRIVSMNHDAVMKLGRRHQIAAMISVALGGDDSYIKQAVRRNILLDAERAKHLAFFEEKGIWYLPLKGIILKDLYPQYGMREMADNDILFDPDYRAVVRDYMVSQGYEVKAYGAYTHDSYHKLPVYNFEFHIHLFAETVQDGAFADYFADLKSRAVKDPDNGYGYHLTDEDLYVYITAHTYKHFASSGTGLRSLTDDYVLRHAKALDFETIDRELEKLGILGFDRTLRSLSEKLFTDPEKDADLSAEEEQMLQYVMGSGVYGTTSNRVGNSLNKYGRFRKLRYTINRIFLPMKTVRASFPLFAKYKVLLPFLPIYRVTRSLRENRAGMKAELKALKKYK